jgi:hypothetical protein
MPVINILVAELQGSVPLIRNISNGRDLDQFSVVSSTSYPDNLSFKFHLNSIVSSLSRSSVFGTENRTVIGL